jgi:hypothetical protein
MAVRSTLRGHVIECRDGEWFYGDTGEPTAHNERSCGHCGQANTPEGHDACLGTLPGIMNACCGHGDLRVTYVQFLDGHAVNGVDAMTVLDILKKSREENTYGSDT